MMSPSTERKIIIRPARPEEAPILVDITNRSKAHWGYDPKFMTMAYSQLVVTPQQIHDNPVYVLEASGVIHGYY
jgi:hypothetical protein